MSVMDADAAGALTGEDQLAQSIAVILTTPLGSRVCRRDFGSDLPDLVDQPMNPGTRQRLLGATALALMRWLPSLKISRIQLVQGDTTSSWTVVLTRSAATDTSSGQLTASLSF